MSRRAFWIAVLMLGCHKGSSKDASSASQAPPLSTTAGSFSIDGSNFHDDCNNDEVDQAFQDLELKFDQVATGLEVFVDPDMGWIPCDGDIDAFTCKWGNAPSSTPAGTWSWEVQGTSDGETVTGTITLTVSCDGTSGCEECSAGGDITGTLESGS